VPEEFDPRLWRDVTRAHSNGLDSTLAAGLGHIDRIFEKNHRIVVRKGDRPASASHCRFCDLLRRGRILNPIKIPGFGDIPVLAEFARQVAASGAEGQDRRARQEVIERLLLDRIDAKTGRAPIGRKYDLIALPRAHEAQAALAFVQFAIARADIALDATILQRVPIAPGCTADGLIHVAHGLSFENVA
jgi:hypothetical protein